MHRRRGLGIAAVSVLVATTVVVFRLYDRHSHSASDTLRPFLLTTAPIWIVAVAVLRRR